MKLFEDLLVFFETYFVLVVIALTGGYFLYKTKFFFILHPIRSLKAALGKGKERKKSIKGLSLALAGTLGVGNIVGVSGAITLGGPGALFWMWVSSVFAMMLKYSETVLAVKYRKRDENGSHGGGMYYMRSKASSRAFTVLCIFASLTLGSSLQSMAVTDTFFQVYGFNKVFIAMIFAVLSFAVITSGKSKIYSFTSKLVPIMTLAYSGMCLIVITVNASSLPSVFKEIFDSAFDFKPILAGGAYSAIRYGTLRGLISNEAGCGTAPIAHSGTDAASPFSSGVMGILEVFIDTVLLCTLTGLSVLLVPSNKAGISSVINAFSSVFGDVSSYILSISVALFAFATVICWFFYGSESIYFFSKSKKTKKTYIAVFCLCIIFAELFDSGLVWAITDLIVALLAVINTFALFTRRNDIIK